MPKGGERLLWIGKGSYTVSLMQCVRAFFVFRQWEDVLMAKKPSYEEVENRLWVKD